MRTRKLALFTGGVAALAMFVGCSSGASPAEDDEISVTEVAPQESAPDASPTPATDEAAPQAVDLNLVTECPPIVNQFSPASDTVYTSIAVPVELLGFAPTTQPTCVRGRPLADGTPRRDYLEMIWVTDGLDPIISFERQLIAAGWPIREGYTEAGDPATAAPFYTWLSPNGAQDMVIANHANPNGVVAVAVVFNSQAP